MNDLTYERYLSDPRLRNELEAAARRERARHFRRLFERSAAARAGRDERAGPVPPLQTTSCG